MEKQFINLKGTYDYLPDKQIIRENIKNTLTDIFKKYGFAPVETPILCYYDLLASKYSEGADILNEMYKLSDQGLRELGLRYDLTITFCKLISSDHNMTMPFKRYEIGKVFRDGPIKLGRNREFTQCDIDMVGVESVLAEAEYLTMTEEGYRKLGLEVEILFNNRKLLSGIIQTVFSRDDEAFMRGCIMLVDKYAKLSKQELYNEFEKIGACTADVDRMNKLLGKSFDELKMELTPFMDNSLIKEGLEEVETLVGYLSGTKAEKCLVFAPYLARGIDIYTGTVWEVFLKDKSIGDVEFSVSLGGGGRYDKIITNFVNDGKTYPAVGMSFGLDVIYEVLKLKNAGTVNSVVELFLIPMGTERETFRIATLLRNAGLRVEMEKKSQKIKKSMNYANKMNDPFVSVIGENEVDNQKISVKRMEDGKSCEFSFDDVEGIIKYIRE